MNIFKHPIYFFGFLAGIMVPLLVYIVFGFERKELADFTMVLIYITAGTTFFAVVARSGLSYLGSKPGKSRAPSLMDAVADAITSLVRRSQSIKDVSLNAEFFKDESEREKFIGDTKEWLKNIVGDAIRTEIILPAQSEIPAGAANNVMKAGENIKLRLSDEILELEKRSNLALIIGLIFSLAGAIVLGGFMFVAPTTYDSPLHILYYWAPKISVTIFLQIFSYFFLRLYRNGIFEIKYFHNEMTTVRLKLVALESMIALRGAQNIEAALSQYCLDLGRVDRNANLKRGEKSLSAEHDATALLGDDLIVSQVERLAKAFTGASGSSTRRTRSAPKV